MRSIRSKIIIFTLLPLLVTLIFIGYFAVLNKQETEQDLIINRLSSYRALLESGDLSFESLKDVKKLEVLLNERVKYAEIVKKDYSILYSTETAENNDAQNISAIDEAFIGFETTLSIEKDGEAILEYISPLIINQKIVGVLRVDVLNEQTAARINQFALFVIVIIVASILVCYLLIAFLLTKTVLNNIDKLKQAAFQLEQGDLNTPVIRTSNDEIGELAETLEQMRKEVKRSRKSLETANKDLEGTVALRTAELHNKLDELERLNRFMVDREIKMVALKNELNELQKRVP